MPTWSSYLVAVFLQISQTSKETRLESAHTQTKVITLQDLFVCVLSSTCVSHTHKFDINTFFSPVKTGLGCGGSEVIKQTNSLSINIQKLTSTRSNAILLVLVVIWTFFFKNIQILHFAKLTSHTRTNNTCKKTMIV